MVAVRLAGIALSDHLAAGSWSDLAVTTVGGAPQLLVLGRALPPGTGGTGGGSAGVAGSGAPQAVAALLSADGSGAADQIWLPSTPQVGRSPALVPLEAGCWLRVGTAESPLAGIATTAGAGQKGAALSSWSLDAGGQMAVGTSLVGASFTRVWLAAGDHVSGWRWSAGGGLTPQTDTALGAGARIDRMAAVAAGPARFVTALDGLNDTLHIL
ncbi:MAG: hypothetical protein D6832_07590, partial [Alphaproteobacteria bacterium]